MRSPVASRRQQAEAQEREEERLQEMNPSQLAAYYARKSATLPIDYPRFAPGAVIAAEEDRKEAQEAANREREAREQELGLPAAQAAYDERVQAIADARDAAIREAIERCREDERAVREQAESELEQLGERPTLDTLVTA